MSAKIEVYVDTITQTEISNLNRALRTITAKLEKRDKKIAQMEVELAGFEEVKKKLWELYDIMKYKLDIDDGNERC
jgi:predicted nuclease with TOPRIM domain